MQMTTSLSFIIFAALAACMLHGAIVEAVAMPYCNPDVYESLPPRLRRICAALYGIGEITNAVEQSLDEKGIHCLKLVQKSPTNIK